MPKRSTAMASIELRPDGGLLLGVVADTHSHPNEQGLAHLAALKPNAILHAGDVGDLAVLDQLQQIAPVFAVRGNIDSHAPELPDVLTIDVMDQGKRVLRTMLLHIAVLGPKIRSDVANRARAQGASLVVCGHSHVPFMGQEKNLTVFNPGSIGPKRFTLPILFGAIEIAPKNISLRHIDALTGKAWAP
jgi:putative phosphoesterase